MNKYSRTVEKLNEGIIHVVYAQKNKKSDSFSGIEKSLIFQKANKVFLEEKAVKFHDKQIYKYIEKSTDAVIKKQTANGEVSCREPGSKIPDYMSTSSEVRFRVNPDAVLTGMGQMEDGQLKQFIFIRQIYGLPFRF